MKDDKTDDDWTGDLNLNAERLRNYLGEDSPVFASIQESGEYLLRVRRLVKDLHLAVETGTANDITVEAADQVNEAMSCLFRSPGIRFYNFYVRVNSVVRACASNRLPEKMSVLPWSDPQYHAAVTHSLACQTDFLMSKDARKKSKVIKTMSACLKARPDDAEMQVTFATFLMVNGHHERAIEPLQRALELDEERCFASHYTLANIFFNMAPPVEDVGGMNPRKQLRALALTESCRTHLEKYLALAPTGHWHMHRACILLIPKNAELSAHGTETYESIERRTPGFCATNHDLFVRGVEALDLYTNCYGREASDFNAMYRDVAGMMSSFHRCNLVPGRRMPVCKFVCANPMCAEDAFGNVEDSGKAIESLRSCNACGAVRYCSRSCQVQHWKMKDGHKQDCKRLAKEREEQRKLPKQKMMKNGILTSTG